MVPAKHFPAVHVDLMSKIDLLIDSAGDYGARIVVDWLWPFNENSWVELEVDLYLFEKLIP